MRRSADGCREGDFVRDFPRSLEANADELHQISLDGFPCIISTSLAVRFPHYTVPATSITPKYIT